MKKKRKIGTLLDICVYVNTQIHLKNIPWKYYKCQEKGYFKTINDKKVGLISLIPMSFLFIRQNFILG
jgi:hypothetical protein